MKTNTFVVCPNCNSVKLTYPATGVIFWRELNCFEQSAIMTIQDSDVLPILLGEIEMQEENCPNCNLCDHGN